MVECSKYQSSTEIVPAEPLFVCRNLQEAKPSQAKPSGQNLPRFELHCHSMPRQKLSCSTGQFLERELPRPWKVHNVRTQVES